MKYYILFGPPGAGKGTQAGAIAEKYNVKHISTGALLRAEIAAGTEVGIEAKKLIEKGKLVSDDMVEEMLENYFASTRDTEGYLLDGFPRTLNQARDLDRLLAKKGEEVSAVISLMIPDAVIAERIQHRAAIEGRADDADMKVIKTRIATYHAQTEPIIDFYREAGKYHEVDGTGSIDEVKNKVSVLMDALHK